jgi:hypothetical protein
VRILIDVCEGTSESQTRGTPDGPKHAFQFMSILAVVFVGRGASGEHPCLTYACMRGASPPFLNHFAEAEDRVFRAYSSSVRKSLPYGGL